MSAMKAPPCSWRTGTNETEEFASDSLRSSVSSPGMPKTYRTPSASRHSTKTSDARRALKSPTPWFRCSLYLGTASTATLPGIPGPNRLMRRLFRLRPRRRARCSRRCRAPTPRAASSSRAAASATASGMSQYGAMGFAQHGKRLPRDPRPLLHGHRSSRSLDARPTVRVLLQTGRSQRRRSPAPSQAGDRRLQPGKTYRAAPSRGAASSLRSATGRKLKTFAAPLRVVGARGAPVRLVGGAHNGAVPRRARAAPGAARRPQRRSTRSASRTTSAASSRASRPSSWPAEALKAQAVAARTYAITTNKPGAGFDHYPDTRSQVYGGVAAETPTTDAAVAATRSEVVTYHGRAGHHLLLLDLRRAHRERRVRLRRRRAQAVAEVGRRPVRQRLAAPPLGRSAARSAQAKREARRRWSRATLKEIQVVQRGVSPRIVKAEIVGTARHDRGRRRRRCARASASTTRGRTSRSIGAEGASSRATTPATSRPARAAARAASRARGTITGAVRPAQPRHAGRRPAPHARRARGSPRRARTSARAGATAPRSPAPASTARCVGDVAWPASGCGSRAARLRVAGMATAERGRAAPALDAATLCEAFQITAAERPDQPAVRVPRDGGLTLTYAELDRARPRLRRAARRARRRPRRHRRDHAHQPARVLRRRPRGDAPRRDPVLDLQHVVAGADRLPVRQRRQPRRRDRGGVPAGDRGRRASTATIVMVDERRSGHERRRRSTPGARRARRRAHAHLHVGDDRAAEGRAAHAPQPPDRDPRAAARCRRSRRAGGSSRSCPPRTSPTAGARTTRRSAASGFTVTTRRRPARGHRRAARGAADGLGRGAADLGEAQGGARGAAG